MTEDREWFDAIVVTLAEEADLDLAQLELPVHIRDEILELARIASHDSGERINAPLLCYTLGLAVGQGATLEQLAGIIRSHTDA